MKATLKGSLIAWDPVAGKARWTVPLPMFWNAGVLASAGGLVFEGNGDGKFVAYDAKTGKPLWSYDAGVGITAAPMTYRVGDTQYVAIMVGYGGAAPLAAHFALPDRPRMPGRLLVFKLGGTDTAPAYPAPQRLTVNLTGVTSTGDPKAGFTLFERQLLDLPRPQRLGPLPARPEDLADDPHPKRLRLGGAGRRAQVERHGQLRQVPRRRPGRVDPRLHPAGGEDRAGEGALTGARTDASVSRLSRLFVHDLFLTIQLPGDTDGDGADVVRRLSESQEAVLEPYRAQTAPQPRRTRDGSL